MMDASAPSREQRGRKSHFFLVVDASKFQSVPSDIRRSHFSSSQRFPSRLSAKSGRRTAKPNEEADDHKIKAQVSITYSNSDFRGPHKMPTMSIPDQPLKIERTSK
jgi:hypothetical protein